MTRAALLVIGLTSCLLLLRLAGVPVPWLVVFGPIWLPPVAVLVGLIVAFAAAFWMMVADLGRKTWRS